MILQEFPHKEAQKQLKRTNSYNVLSKIAVFLSVVLLIFIGFRVVFSGPGDSGGGAGIAGTGPGECNASGMTAWQCDFATAGTNIAVPNYFLNIDSKGNSVQSADIGGIPNNFGNAAPGNAQLPFNVFFPGRGQKDEFGNEYVVVELNTSNSNSKRSWWLDSSSLGINANNVPSVQKINTERLNLVFGGDNSGFGGLVFGNDANPPQILVVRYHYIGGKAQVNPATDIKRFNINSANYSLTSDNRVDGNPNIIDHRGCGASSVPGTNYVAQDNPVGGWPTTTTANIKYNDGITDSGGGLLHDVHLVRTAAAPGYKFIVTIINAGVLELTPAGGSNLTYTWGYLMPNFCNTYVAEWRNLTPYECPDHRYAVDWQYRRLESGITHTWHRERSTTWYAQPVDNGDGLWDQNDSLLISVGPWKSYKDNILWSTERFRHFSIGGNSYNDPNCCAYVDPIDRPPVGYPRTNNDLAVYVARSEVRRIQRNAAQTKILPTYGPGDSNKPKYAGNIVVNDSDLNYINSNYFEVSDSSGVCGPWQQSLEEGDVPDFFNYGINTKCWYSGGPPYFDNFPFRNGPEIFNNASARLNLKDTTFQRSGDTSQSHYSETMYKTPSGDFLINGGGIRALPPGGSVPFGYPAIVDPNTQKTEWWGNPDGQGIHNISWYAHLGAGNYATYGTPKTGFPGWTLIGKQINTAPTPNYRDGGLASQLGPPPANYYVRDFTLMKTQGDDTKSNNANDGQNSKLAYALANEYGTIFRDPTNLSGLNQANNNIDISNLAEDLISTGHLEQYQQIYLTALMWGDIGKNFNQFQKSNTPVLQSWGINYEDKTAQFGVSKTGLTGTKGDPTDPEYGSSAGSNHFYTGAGHNMARYLFSATNADNETSWPATSLQLSDALNQSGNRVTFNNNPADPNRNLAYYRIYRAGGEQDLIVRAKGTNEHMKVRVNGQDRWSGNINYAGYTNVSIPGVKPNSNDCVDIVRDSGVTPLGTLWVESITVNNAVSGGGPVIISSDAPGTMLDFCNGCPATYSDRTAYDGVFVRYGGGGWGAQSGWMNCLGVLRFPGKTRLTVRATGHHDPGGVWPKMRVAVNGIYLRSITTGTDPAIVDHGSITNDPPYTSPVDVRSYIYYFTPTRDDKVNVSSTNDWEGGQDNNLCVGSIGLRDNMFNNNPLGECIKIDNGAYGSERDCGMKYGRSSSETLYPYDPPRCPVKPSVNCSPCAPPPCPCPPPGGSNPEDCNWRCRWQNWWGGWTFWNGTFRFPGRDVLGPSPEIPWSPASVTVLGNKLTITPPPGEVVNIGDRLEITYTTTIQNAGKIDNTATLTFKNRGNSVPAPPVSKTCTGNAPYIKTLYGDVYLGGGTNIPYFGYMNATFLIQDNGALSNFNTSKPGWIQNNYALSPDLQLGGAAGKVETEVDRLIRNGQLNSIPAGNYNIGSLPDNKAGVICESGDLNISGQMPADKGAKLIVVRNGNLNVTGNVTYSSGMVGGSDLKKLASLGVVVLNGNLNVNPAVTQMDGAYFVNGTFNTCTGQTPDQCENQLITNGLWIAKRFILGRTWVGASASPAELISYDGRVVLNPPAGLSALNLPLWKEVAP
jgi:hypothetical protein